MNKYELVIMWRTNVLLFLIYSFAGAVAEHVSYALHEKFDPATAPKKLLSNPILTGFPLYGAGAFLLVGLHKLIVPLQLPAALQWVVEFLVYGAAMSGVEYVVGRWVGAGTSLMCRDPQGNEMRVIDSWDYSDKRYNWKGIIDARHFILFGLAGLGVARLHPWLKQRVQRAVA